MKVILTKDVQNVGETGDVVNVADGYARNFLIPNKNAVVATEGALKNRDRNIERIKAKAQKLHDEALDTANQIQAIGQLQLTAKAGESGKLFGSVTTKRLAEEILEKTGLQVDRKNITLDRPINQIGEYSMKMKLTSKVVLDLPVIISASEVLQERIEEVKEEETIEE